MKAVGDYVIVEQEVATTKKCMKTLRKKMKI